LKLMKTKQDESGRIIIEGTAGLEFITNGLRGDAFEDYVDIMMLEVPNAVAYAAMELRAEWAADSNSPISYALEAFVAEMFVLEPKHYHHIPYELPGLSNTHKEAAREIYRVTQALLTSKNVESVILYRGIGWNQEEQPHWVRDDIELGDPIVLPARTLSSWSFDPEIARSFVSRYDNGYVLKSIVRPERIFAIIDVDGDQESVCIYNTEAYVIEIVKKEVQQ
jgi:hypothetical protein